jgi:hypothetical protein
MHRPAGGIMTTGGARRFTRLRHANLPLRAFGRPARMANDAPRLSLLEELDARQNELLDELDQLNVRIEQVLQECLPWRGDKSPAGRSAAA